MDTQISQRSWQLGRRVLVALFIASTLGFPKLATAQVLITPAQARAKVLFSEYTNVANAADTNFVTTTSYSLPGGTLASVADELVIEWDVLLNATAGSKSFVCNIGFSAYSAASGFTGGLTLFTQAANTQVSNSPKLTIHVWVINSTTAAYEAKWLIPGATNLGTIWATGSLTWANAQSIACTAKDANSNAGIITLETFKVVLRPNLNY